MPQQSSMNMPVSGSSNGSGSGASTTPQKGVVLIEAGSPLTRLNYFDGKFLRATDLKAEQTYVRRLVELSNQAGGPGVAYGYSVALASNNQLLLSPGLAIDPKGRLLLLTDSQTVKISDLLSNPAATPASGAASSSGVFVDCPQATGTGVTLLQPNDLYLLVICHAETLCGQEDVYGKLCQEACVTSTDRPFAVEGIVVQLVPLNLQTALPVSTAVSLGAQHLRSRVASAYFQDERGVIADLISKAGLAAEIWCQGAAAATGCCVALGVVGLAGSTVGFLDAWTARRERMDPPAKRYWQWRMRMRPWDVFIAQILQFQCQLRDGLQTGPGTVDPCANTRNLAGEAVSVLTLVQQYFEVVSRQLAANVSSSTANLNIPGGVDYVSGLITRITQAQQSAVAVNRLLINQGIIELPSAGYLPVTPGAAITINDQVVQWMGEGVNLRFCVVTPDYVQHALEEAQHMERISLIAGLDNPAAKPDVDILVPNGQILPSQPPSANLFAANVQFTTDILTPLVRNAAGGPTLFAQIAVPPPTSLEINGAARAELLDSGSSAFYLSGQSTASSSSSSSETYLTGVSGLTAFSAFERAPTLSTVGLPNASPDTQFWAELKCNANPFSMSTGTTTPVSLRMVLGHQAQAQTVIDFVLRGDFRLDAVDTIAATATNPTRHRIQGRISAVASVDVTTPFSNGPQEQAGSVSLTVFLEACSTPTGPAVVLRLEEAQGSFSFQFDLKGTNANPLELDFDIENVLSQGLVSKAPVTGTLLASPDVAKSSNNSHVAAVSAIQNLASLLDDSGFAVEALNELFPPPPAVLNPQVIGTLDWVLFHRRRVKNCGPTEETAVITRKYRVYLFGQPSGVYTRGFQTAAVEVAVVEFAADSATLISPVSSLLTAWKSAAPGDLILFGGIYSIGAAATDGDTLATGRLVALETALSPVTPTSPSAPVQILSTLPATASVADVDGAIILMTVSGSSSSSSSSSASASDLLANILGPKTPPTIAASSKIAAVGGLTIVFSGGVPGQTLSVTIAVVLGAPTASAGQTDQALLADSSGTMIQAAGSGSTYTFPNVSVSGNDVITISNMKINPAGFGVAGQLVPVQATVEFIGASLHYNNPVQTVAFVTLGSSSSSSSASASPLVALAGATTPILPRSVGVGAVGVVTISISGGEPGQRVPVTLTLLLSAATASNGPTDQAVLTDSLGDKIQVSGSGNQYVFPGLQISGNDVITVSNMKINVNSVAGSASGAAVPVTANVAFSGATVVTVSNPVVTVAFVA